MDANKTLQIAALGRPLELGMLYDIRRDIIIPGLTLWDKEVIRDNVREALQPNTSFKIIASDSVEDKASSLDVSASLKASFLGGLIEVGGSAKFLNEKKQSRKQARVTLQYSATAKFEQLSMNHLAPKNIQYPSVFDQKDVTHVVTAVLYGANAFFVFDRNVSDSEDRQEIEGSLHIAVKSIPSFSIEGEGSIQLNQKLKETVDTFSCTFCGDFALKSNPATYEEAIKVFATLPSLLDKSVIPIKVWLHPISDFDSRASRMVREVSAALINDVQDVLEELSYFNMHCNDLLKERAAVTFPDITNKIKKFRKYLQDFCLSFQKEVARLLPAIRGAGKEESALVDLLLLKETSPFDTVHLTTFLQSREEEINFVNAYLKVLQGIKVTSSTSELNQIVIDPMVDCLFSFTFTSLQDDEPYLNEQKQWIETQYKKTSELTETRPGSGSQKTQKWFNDQEIIGKSRMMVKTFADFANSYQSVPNRKLQFSVSSVQDTDNPGVSIYWYEGAMIKSKAFEPPRETVPKVKYMTHDGGHFYLPANIAENMLHSTEIPPIKLQYRNKGEDSWIAATAVVNEKGVFVIGLTPNSVYEFRQYVEYKGMHTAPGDSTDFLTTLPTSPPRRLQQVKEKAGVLTLIWQQPEVIAAGYHISEYRIEYKEKSEQADTWIEKKVGYQELKSFIEGLNLNTDYSVRVSAIGDDQRSSLPSYIRVFSLTQEPRGPPDIHHIFPPHGM